MAFLDSKRDRAALLIFVLGMGLVWTLWPFITGLLGAPVLYVVFAPVHRWLAQRTRPRIAAGAGGVARSDPGAGAGGLLSGNHCR